MKSRLEPLFEVLLGCVVLGGVAWGLWWLTDGATHLVRFWWTLASVFFIVPAILYAGFFAYIVISHSLDKRRCARAGRPWQP